MIVKQAHATQAAGVLTGAAATFNQTPTSSVNNLHVLAMDLYVYSWLPNFLIQPVLDFLLEALPPTQEMLDSLAGDPHQITAHTNAIMDTARKVYDPVRPDFRQAADEALHNWTGEASDEFKALVIALDEVFEAYPPVVRNIALVELVAGDNVGAVRALVRDTISDMIVELVREAGRLGLTAGAGAVGGAMVGAAVGSIFGPVGTLVGGLIGGLVGGVGAAVAEFIRWAAGFVAGYLQYLSQVLQDLLSVTTQSLGQVRGLGNQLDRAARILRTGHDPGAYGEVAPGSHGASMIGTDPVRADMTLAGINAVFPDPDATVTDPTTGEVYHPLSDDELANLGIPPELLQDDETGFIAGVYMARDENGNPILDANGQPKLVVVFGGTTVGPGGAGPDVVEDGIGGVVPSEQAMAAMRLAEHLQSQAYGDAITYTGHSLGGRLAAVASMTTGNPAVTYNAAGVSDPMIAYIAGVRGITPEQLMAEMEGGTVRGYQTSDDPLTLAQEHIPGLSGTMHDAPGTQHPIPGASGSILEGHFMDNVLESMQNQYPGFKPPIIN